MRNDVEQARRKLKEAEGLRGQAHGGERYVGDTMVALAYAVLAFLPDEDIPGIPDQQDRAAVGPSETKPEVGPPEVK